MECKVTEPSRLTNLSGELIDTLWNVKLLARINFVSVQYRINRYTVECKGKYVGQIDGNAQELIDTLWNVKVEIVDKFIDAFLELIDTLWNVKTAFLASLSGFVRINRYTVECKDSCDRRRDWCNLELIDTLWNVK